MWRRIIKTFVVTLILVLAVGSAVISYLRPRPQTDRQPTITRSAPVAPPPSSSPALPVTTEVVPVAPVAVEPSVCGEMNDRFVRAGWSVAAAAALLELNCDWFTMLSTSHSLAFSKQLTLLIDLGNHQRLMPFLANHPESGALFAVSEQPDDLLRLFESTGADYDFLVNLYVLHAAPLDGKLLTDALRNNGDLISRLYRRGLVGSEVIFFFERSSESGFEYDQWLREVFTVKLDRGDDELASLLNMVLKHGPEIRLRLRDNDSFRRTFRATIWPRLVRVAADNLNMFDLYLDDPRIWDLLALPEGEELLRLRGLLPIDLLYGYSDSGRAPYPEDLHGTVIQALLLGDEQTIRALVKFRAEPLFHDLARRDVSSSVKNAAFTRLFEAGAAYQELLQRYNVMTDEGLRGEVGPPPGVLKNWTPFYYTLWEVPKKIFQGRNPTTTDWFNSLADPVSFLYPILKIGVAVVNVKQTFFTFEEDDRNESDLRQTGLEIAGAQLGPELASRLSSQELIPFGVTGMLTRMQDSYREKVSTLTVVDSTGVVRFMFGYSGASHSSLAALDLVEGHILLRGDGRLVVQPGNDFSGPEVRDYLVETARRFVLNSAPPGPAPSLPDNLKGWRQNISGWWLMQASGMLRKTAGGSQTRP